MGRQPATKGRSHNPEIARGINRYPASRMYHLNGRRYVKNKGKQEKKTTTPAVRKSGRFFALQSAPKRLHRNFTPKPAKLRSSFEPGKVLIVLSGPYRGKRVVFLKQLESGLILITGPHKLNGVPLRRMNARNVIVTSTKVDLGKINLRAIDDSLFKKPVKKAPKKSEENFFATENKEQKKELPAEFKELQKKVDGQVVPAIKKVDKLDKYLKSLFSLDNGQFPHEMKF